MLIQRDVYLDKQTEFIIVLNIKYHICSHRLYNFKLLDIEVKVFIDIKKKMLF